MKKIISIFLLLSLIFSMNVSFSLADTLSTDQDLKVIHYDKLKELGYSDYNIKFLDERIIPEIVENNQRLESSTTAHNLFLTYSVENSSKDDSLAASADMVAIPSEITVTVELSDSELTEYLKNREKFIKAHAKTMKDLIDYKGVKNILIKDKNVSKKQKSEDLIVALGTTATDNINFGTITTTLNVSDASTTSACYKRLALDFEWLDDPSIYWEDAMGIAHSGASLGMTNVSGTACVVKSLGRTSYSTVDYTADGFKSKFMLRDQCYGTMYGKVGNYKSAVTKGALFVAYARYGHTYYGFGSPSVTLSTSGVSIDAGLGSLLSETTQVQQNNIYTYY